jgi:hypothetical protein
VLCCLSRIAVRRLSLGLLVALGALLPAATPATGADALAAGRADPADAAFEALELYWRTAGEGVLSGGFESLAGGTVPLDGGAAAGSALCISTPEQILGNAYYCAGDDGIVYDTAVLVPVLLHRYGPDGLLASLAHEYGHAIAARLPPLEGPAVLRELQADCFAGNFLFAATERAPSNPRAGDPDTGNTVDILAAMAPLLDFTDQVASRPDDPAAHGLAIDRALAISLGYHSTPSTCANLKAGQISMVLGRFDDPGVRTRRFPSDDAVIAAARQSLKARSAATGTAATTGTAGNPADLTPDLLAATRPYGQFALAAAVVYATARASGRDGTGAACVTGAWTAAVLSESSAPDELGGRLSDPDDALNLIRTRPGATAQELFAFLDGFSSGCG